MNVVCKYTIGLLVFISQIVSSQSNIGNEEVLLNQIINTENQIQYEKTTTQVSITQIGNQNFVKVNLINDKSNYSIYQKGFLNNIELIKPYFKSSSDEYYAQNGSNNYISQKSIFSNNMGNNIIIQTGNNLSFQSFGENSISNKIIFSQSGNFGNILMFNR